MTAHWGIEDPAAVTGTQDQQRAAFHKAYRELEARIKIFASLPLATLDRTRLQARLDDISPQQQPL
jgi:arsenate reductase